VKFVVALLLMVATVGALSFGLAGPAVAGEWQQTGTRVPRVNLPHDVPAAQRAIFWFGDVYLESNSANVRLGYDDHGLQVHVHTFDRHLRVDMTPSSEELTQWDAMTLYLAPSGSATRHRFTGELSVNGDSRGNYQAAYQDTGSGWQAANTSFTVETGWRGDGVNDPVEDRGWWIGFHIPFSSLGLSGPPAPGTIWRAALEMHDRDATAGPPLPVQTWPEVTNLNQPTSWAELRFGLAAANSSPAVKRGELTVRHGLNGAVVPDAHVGGHTICGRETPFWTEWGQANYATYGQINIQNQWDVADWPCYSRYYVTFPLHAIPAEADAITSATLTMYQFGSAGQEYEPPPPSYIQVLAIDEPWLEETISWNNSPPAVENYGGAWVEPFQGDDYYPGRAISWDVTRAAAQAFAAGQPLRLVLYSADTAYNSGRYFWSSDAQDGGRPRLDISWGQFINLPNSHYLPFLAEPR
jgi:hypothetical protein